MEHNAQNFMNWLNYGTGCYKAEHNVWQYCATKVPYTNICDLLFGNYTSTKRELIEMDNMELLGFYNKVDGKVWMYAGLSHWFWNIEKPDVYDNEEVIKEMKVRYQQELIQQLIDDTEWLVRENATQINEQISAYKECALISDAQIIYVSGEVKPLVSTENVKFAASDIVGYLENRDLFFKQYVRNRIIKDAEMYTLILMRNELISSAVMELEANTPIRLKQYKTIRDIVKVYGATKVNLVLRNAEGREIEFKYPVSELCRCNGDWIYSGYKLTAGERNRLKDFKLANGDIPLYERSDIVPEDIVAITYKKKVLYERGD